MKNMIILVLLIAFAASCDKQKTDKEAIDEAKQMTADMEKEEQNREKVMLDETGHHENDTTIRWLNDSTRIRV
jgi:hypothetical protein